MRNWVLCFLLIMSTIAFSSNVLVDDAPMCGHHDRTTFQVLWDSLAAHGASIDFTTESVRYPDLSGYDLLILMHHNYCDDAGFDYDQR